MLKNEVDPENSNGKEGEPGTALVYAICALLMQINCVRVIRKDARA
jgi:hypothetical protein